MSTTTTRTSDDLHVVLGSGPAGTTVAVELAVRGHRVTLVDRSGEGRGLDGVDRAVTDATDAGQFIAATAGATVIYHCVNVAYHLQGDVMPRVTTAVLAAAAANDARLVVLDTLYPYGEADGNHITEGTPWATMTGKGLLRAALDRRYLRPHTTGAARVVAGRAADFYGPRILKSALGGGVFPGALTGSDVYTFGERLCPTATATWGCGRRFGHSRRASRGRRAHLAPPDRAGEQYRRGPRGHRRTHRPADPGAEPAAR